MTKPLIGYHSKKRRKWPRVIVLVFIIFIAFISIILLKPDFNNLKKFYASSDKNELTEIPESNKSNDIINANDTQDNTSYLNEKLDTKEPNQEDLSIIKENFDNSSEQKFNSSLKIVENKDTLNLSSEKISEKKTDAKSDSNTIKKEKVYLETENLKSGLNKLEEESKSAEDTFELKNDKYYIIISSVDSKEAADKQQQKFLNMSVKTDVIYVPSNNRYRISLGNYTNFKEASAKSKAFQSKYPAYKTWVWKVQ